MSHTNVIYPQSTDRTVSWQVREERDDYGSTLLNLQDRINDRLARADALVCLLQTADYQLESATQVTAMVLEEHIQQAKKASDKQWKHIRQLLQKRK